MLLVLLTNTFSHEQLKTNDMETYKKVYIKSEADLPKKDGEYFGMEKGSMYSFMSVLDFISDKEFKNRDYWMSYIEWYLQPISAVNEPEKPTDEEIEMWARENSASVSSAINKICGAKWMRNKLIAR